MEKVLLSEPVRKDMQLAHMAFTILQKNNSSSIIAFSARSDADCARVARASSIRSWVRSPLPVPAPGAGRDPPAAGNGDRDRPHASPTGQLREGFRPAAEGDDTEKPAPG